MSADLSFMDSKLDALTNSIWWNLDEKAGRTRIQPPRAHPGVLGTAVASLQQAWDTVAIRLSLAVMGPYVLSSVLSIGDPLRVSLELVLFCLAWPWVYRIFIYNNFLDPLRHLPGPKGNWLFGHGLGVPYEDLGTFQLSFAKTLTAESSPSGLFTYTTFGCRRNIPFTPQAISYFTTSRKYVKTEISNRVVRRITGDGLVVVDGEEHRRQRKIITPAFAGHHVNHLVSSFWLKACELRDFWQTEAVGKDSRYDVLGSLTRTTLDIIGVTGFGYDFGALKDATNPVAQAYFALFENSPEAMLAVLMLALYPAVENLPLRYIQRSNSAKQIIETAATEIITARVAQGGSHDKDILGCMMRENQRLENIGEEGLTNEDLLHQILTFLAAGHETTSTALVWALYELSEHPDIQTRLRAEIHSHLGKSFNPSTPPTADQIHQLKYLDHVCREVLRVNPPVPLTARQAVEDDVYEGLRIPKGSLIHFHPLVANKHPSFWGCDAEEFRPERWEGLKDVSNTNFMTFQNGLRVCVGRRFAEMEMRVVLAVLIGSFEFGKVDGWQVEKYSLITVRPKNGMYLHIKRVE